ncbi:flagellar basal body P-ring biosynthesis protein FlgA [Sporomusa ovata DSM 2662]|uniref:Flagellar basal-body P-ring formation protein FlgA n=1 Tax=Sporomusa ovata TaxID=2378 RepID=A0A0U1KT58_9FIRM|nr:flagellar basal body P-ring formation chaperone FlgA [Sporomusa ovata]EQB26525.1 flagella basal body P-ring formation protein FlgA [Sporomusa ovata DSM 2662]CQR70612.1 Flagellar basal-body P-ring formation protein FlgA [Sporomusa ovata]
MKTNLYRLIMVILCVAGIFFTGQSVQAQELTVSIPPEATITGQYFTLGDIARFNGDDNERIDRLRQIRLGHTPQPGQSYVLAGDILMARMRAARVDLSGITWQLPPQLKVTALAQSISGQELVKQAKQYLEACLTGEVMITSVGQPRDILVPPGEIAFTMALPYGIRYNAPTNVSIGVQVAGRSFSTAMLRFDVKKYQQVAIASRVLNANEPITAESIIFERRDIGRLTPGYFTKLDKILGLPVKRQLAPGIVITETMLGQIVLIRRGQPVTITAKNGGIEVMVSGIALQDGSKGEFIRVKNSNSKKVIRGQVIDDTTVRANI